MLIDVIEVEALERHRLRIRFEDSVEDIVALAGLVPFEGVFAPLRAPSLFAQVRVNQEIGAIEWPNGADLDPDVLYATIAHEPLPSYKQHSERP